MGWINVKNVVPECEPECELPSIEAVAVGSVWECDRCKMRWEVDRDMGMKHWSRLEQPVSRPEARPIPRAVSS